MTGVASNVRVRELGSYVLGRRIGSGGMATVFAARQAGGGLRGATRIVAVKVSANRGDEPQTLAQLDHNNIVRVYDQRSCS